MRVVEAVGVEVGIRGKDDAVEETSSSRRRSSSSSSRGGWQVGRGGGRGGGRGEWEKGRREKGRFHLRLIQHASRSADSNIIDLN